MQDSDQPSPSSSSLDAGLGRVKTLIARARSELDACDPVAALNTLMAALQELGTPENALTALTNTVSALVEGGGSNQAQQPPSAAVNALAGLLAQCSLEASRRVAEAEGGGGVPMEEEAGGSGAAATTPPASILPAGDGGATVVCEACGGQVAVARLAAHVELWCPGGAGAVE